MVRIVAGPESAILDYRGKLPGRAVYVCPNRGCVHMALSRGSLSRALRSKVTAPAVEDFVAILTENIGGKIKSLIAMCAKAGKLAAGFSAVQDALEKNRVTLLIFARDIAAGTREKIVGREEKTVKALNLFSREEFGRLLNRELVGVVALFDTGFANAVRKEAERLKSLINSSE